MHITTLSYLVTTFITLNICAMTTERSAQELARLESAINQQAIRYFINEERTPLTRKEILERNWPLNLMIKRAPLTEHEQAQLLPLFQQGCVRYWKNKDHNE